MGAVKGGAVERSTKAGETKSGSWLNLNYTVRAASPEPKLAPGILISARIARRIAAEPVRAPPRRKILFRPGYARARDGVGGSSVCAAPNLPKRAA